MKLKLYHFILSLLFVAGSTFSYGQDIALNGGFEDWTGGVPDSWTTIEEGITVEQENTIFNNGASAAKVNVLTGTQGMTDFRQTVSIKANNEYVFSFWAYHTDGGVRVTIYADGFTNVFTDPETTGEWQKVSHSFIATEDMDVEVGMRFYDVSGTFDGEEIVYIDDFQVLETEFSGPTMIILSPENGDELQVGDFDIEFQTVNFVVGTPGDAGVDGNVQYTVGPNAPMEHNTTDPIAVTGLVDGTHLLILALKDNAGNILNPDGVDTIQITVASPAVAEVSDIATLRGSAEGEVYKLTGEAVLTFQQSFRNQKFIQDGSGGILIDDTGGAITSAYEIGDGISGITGTLGSFGGMMQFVPLEDPGEPSATGVGIIAPEITPADLTSSFEDYESELVTMNNLTFTAGNGTAVFENGEVYEVSDGTNTYNFRATFFGVDYIGTTIPTMPMNVTGLPNSRNDGEYFTARDLADIKIPTTGNEVANIADLRAGVEGETYTLVGEAVLTYQQSFRNQKYIEDATAGILIDDSDGNITSTYAINDGITGIEGTLGSFGGMLQFIPTSDPGAATSSDNMITPQMITLLELTNNFEAYEAELVMVSDVTFSDMGGTFDNGDVYMINDGTSDYNFRTTFFNVNYIGTTIPETVGVTGIPNSRDDGEYLTARNLEDLDGVEPPMVTEVPDIATLRAAEEGLIYRLTGEAVLTYQQDFRGQKYIQDGTAGILIDDPDGTITTAYAINDGITNLTGRLSSFGGMMQFVPFENPAAATSSGNMIPEQIVTLADLITNFEDHEAEVVTVMDVTFQDGGMGTLFENGMVYPISSGTNFLFRTTFFNVDYIGLEIPEMANISGIPNSRIMEDVEVQYITSRDLGDMDIISSTEDLSKTNFSIFPNPNNGTFAIINEGIAGEYTFEFTDLLGQTVYTTQKQLNEGGRTEIRTNLTTAGMYFVKMRNASNQYVRTLPLIIN